MFNSSISWVFKSYQFPIWGNLLNGNERLDWNLVSSVLKCLPLTSITGLRRRERFLKLKHQSHYLRADKNKSQYSPQSWRTLHRLSLSHTPGVGQNYPRDFSQGFSVSFYMFKWIFIEILTTKRQCQWLNINKKLEACWTSSSELLYH